MDPGPLTFRELVFMAEAAWDRTAALAAIIANANRDPKGKVYVPDDFNPIRRAFKAKDPEPPPLKGDITALKVFLR